MDAVVIECMLVAVLHEFLTFACISTLKTAQSLILWVSFVISCIKFFWMGEKCVWMKSYNCYSGFFVFVCSASWIFWVYIFVFLPVRGLMCLHLLYLLLKFHIVGGDLLYKAVFVKLLYVYVFLSHVLICNLQNNPGMQISFNFKCIKCR